MSPTPRQLSLNLLYQLNYGNNWLDSQSRISYLFRWKFMSKELFFGKKNYNFRKSLFDFVHAMFFTYVYFHFHSQTWLWSQTDTYLYISNMFFMTFKYFEIVLEVFKSMFGKVRIPRPKREDHTVYLELWTKGSGQSTDDNCVRLSPGYFPTYILSSTSSTVGFVFVKGSVDYKKDGKSRTDKHPRKKWIKCYHKMGFLPKI